VDEGGDGLRESETSRADGATVAAAVTTGAGWALEGVGRWAEAKVEAKQAGQGA